MKKLIFSGFLLAVKTHFHFYFLRFFLPVSLFTFSQAAPIWQGVLATGTFGRKAVFDIRLTRQWDRALLRQPTIV